MSQIEDMRKEAAQLKIDITDMLRKFEERYEVTIEISGFKSVDIGGGVYTTTPIEIKISIPGI